jgi:hypothetical protein
MTPNEEAAAMHGIATNPAFPLKDRLQAALQALAWYTREQEYDSCSGDGKYHATPHINCILR